MRHPDKLTLTTELRAKTAQAHEALDSKLAHAFEQVERYSAFLRASYRVLSQLDTALASLVQRPLAERCALIVADLQLLGQPSPSAGPDTWRPSDVAESMGSAYVVEGSRLGGLVLAKMVERHLGLRATNYLRGKGALTDTKNLWINFVSELDDWGEHATRDERKRAARGAIATFSAYARCFADEGLMEG